MIKNVMIKFFFLFTVFSFLLNCSSSNSEDCTKQITIPQFYIVNNQSYSYDITQEVSCDLPDPEVKQIDPVALDGFTYEVINFLFIPDTGTNTSRLQFEIKLNNPSSNIVNGVTVATLRNSQGLQYSINFLNNSSCSQIEANGSCILIFDEEASLDLGIIENIELIDVEYFLTQ